jgi:hypothetical protein
VVEQLLASEEGLGSMDLVRDQLFKGLITFTERILSFELD